MDFVSYRIMRQIGLSVVTSVPFLWGMLIMGRAVHVGDRVHRKALYVSLNFVMNLQLL